MTLIIATLACLYCFGLGWVIGLAANLRHEFDVWEECDCESEWDSGQWNWTITWLVEPETPPQRDMVPRGTELQEWRWQ